MSQLNRKPVHIPKTKFNPSRVEIRQNSDEKRPIRANVRVISGHSKSNGKPWENMSMVGALPPLATTVTSVNQAYELQSTRKMDTGETGGNLTSSDWLGKHSLESERLTVEDLMKQGILIRPPTGYPDNTPHLKFEARAITQFEFKLARVIEECQKRINWLTEGSRKIFGLLKGQRVAILVDMSDANCRYGRLELLQQSLQGLVNEQLVNKDQLYLLSFGSRVEPLWETTHDVNCRIMNEVRNWVNTLHPSGGCNLLGAIRQLVKWKNIDSVVVVLGSSPDQKSELICQYVRQSLAGRQLPFHTIAYNCLASNNDVFLEELATMTGGRYHCYSSSSNEKIFTGTDLQLLTHEIERAEKTMRIISEMRNGRLENKLITIVNDKPKVAMEILPVPDGTIVQRNKSSEYTLNVENPSFPARTSLDWLKQHGLKARGLNLYQVLAPNAYSYVKGYVSTINKDVKSKVYKKSMAQFPWHDGSIKNVHVDPTLLFVYQEQLDSTVQHYLRRIDWLSTGCQQIFGTLVEQRVIIIVDISVSTRPCFNVLKKDLKVLFEQQMANKKHYNVICYGSSGEMFRPSMVNPSPEYLQASWRWLLQKSCNGSRNVLEAFRMAVENNEDITNNTEVEGIYLISTGPPDSPEDLICSFIKESLSGKDVTLNTIYYEDEIDSSCYLPGRSATPVETAECLKKMAHAGRGRFHWYKIGAGIMESDDVTVINGELNKAYNYSQNTAMLLDSVKRNRYPEEKEDPALEDQKALVPAPPQEKPKPLPPPKQTALSQARLNGIRSRPSTANGHISRSSKKEKKKQRTKSAVCSSQDVSVKPLCWKPNSKNSSTGLIPDISRTGSKERETPSAQRQVFYTEIGNSVGAILKDYPSLVEDKKSIRRPIKEAYIPEKDENISTREWMRKYSIAKLKLDLNQLAGGAECSHSKSKVSSLHKTVPARYCDIFPTVKMKGVMKHLHLTPRELEEYEEEIEKVMKRYVKRLQWLMSGSRRIFGTVIEKKVVILVDTSYSMARSLPEIQTQLIGLIWEQLRELNIMFNLVKFSNEPTLWRPSLVAPSEENCEDAVEWIKTFQAFGSASTVQAMQAAFQDPGIEGIYLVTDGKPDTSTTMVLRELAKLNNARQVRVHTISFNCDDSSANKFLQLMAGQSGGRFHRSQSEAAGHLLAHRLLTEKVRSDEALTIPVFDGDDLRRLGSEITLCRKFLLQARSFRTLLHEYAKSGQETKIQNSKQYLQTGSSNTSKISLGNPTTGEILAN
ncbi:von Willebrand factor A domain-containing protein 3A-like [Dendronephthya gigantea]|uniref:von Willebrand factor A domain-containing protein 3A-like n=1 Tax=Dendronephthya gigantea TaxID=151771 RepID=UPI00106DADB5|nr:von Willebrand factor A domain-containing protein 3A-like [Dendronephthya gigantea]